jgi:MOSC domain-containing protein YiiM
MMASLSYIKHRPVTAVLIGSLTAASVFFLWRYNAWGRRGDAKKQLASPTTNISDGTSGNVETNDMTDAFLKAFQTSDQGRCSVVAVARSAEHNFSKTVQSSITLVEGLGIEGDAHKGATVQHLSRIKKDPSQPNLRQVHLIGSEVLERVTAVTGDAVLPGQLGENITTAGIDLVKVPRGTIFTFRSRGSPISSTCADKDVCPSSLPPPTLRVTGLRNPCPQIDNFRPGLLDHCRLRDASGNILERYAGIMCVVVHGGEVLPDDMMDVVFPAERPWHPLEVV